MSPASSLSPKVQIEQHAFSGQATAGEPSEKLATSAISKGKSWGSVRGIPNPFYYLWKYGPLAIGTGLLLMARACSAQNQESCLKLMRHDSRQSSISLHDAWLADDAPEPKAVGMLFLDYDKKYEVALDGMKPGRVDSRTITPIFLMNLEKPQVVNLKDMTLVEGILYNRTPYTVDGLYVEDICVSYVNFARPVQGYTAVHLAGCEFCRHKIVDITTVGNNLYDFAPDTLSEHPGARVVNARERLWLERMQIFQHHWANSPGALCEIENDEAAKYSRPACSHAPCSLDDSEVYRQPLSGTTTRVLIDPTLAADTDPVPPILKITGGPTDSSFTLRINPELIEGGSGIEPEKVRDTAKSLVHSYASRSGLGTIYLPSGVCLNDQCADNSTPAFPDYPGERYTPANLVVNTDRLGGTVYRFELKTTDTVSDLRMRVSSYQVLSATVLLSDKDWVYLEFNELPGEDVHVSFYSRESEQMASVTLSEFTSVVEGKEAVSRLKNPDVLAAMLMKNLEIIVKTDDSVWLSEFHLPYPHRNRVVWFKSKSSDLRSGSAIHYGGGTYYLYKGQIKCSAYSHWECIRSNP